MKWNDVSSFHLCKNNCRKPKSDIASLTISSKLHISLVCAFSAVAVVSVFLSPFGNNRFWEVKRRRNNNCWVVLRLFFVHCFRRHRKLLSWNCRKCLRFCVIWKFDSKQTRICCLSWACRQNLSWLCFYRKSKSLFALNESVFFVVSFCRIELYYVRRSTADQIIALNWTKFHYCILYPILFSSSAAAEANWNKRASRRFTCVWWTVHVNERRHESNYLTQITVSTRHCYCCERQSNYRAMVSQVNTTCTGRQTTNSSHTTSKGRQRIALRKSLHIAVFSPTWSANVNHLFYCFYCFPLERSTWAQSECRWFCHWAVERCRRTTKTKKKNSKISFFIRLI